MSQLLSIFSLAIKSQSQSNKIISTIMVVLNYAQSYTPSFKAITRLVLEKKIVKGFYNISKDQIITLTLDIHVTSLNYLVQCIYYLGIKSSYSFRKITNYHFFLAAKHNLGVKYLEVKI